MVTVTDFLERKSQEGESFWVMVVESDPEIVKSESGKFYARTMKATIPTTFSPEIGKKMIGKKLSGKIHRVPCETYTYEVDGEEMELSWTYQYTDEKSVEEVLFEDQNI